MQIENLARVRTVREVPRQMMSERRWVSGLIKSRCPIPGAATPIRGGPANGDPPKIIVLWALVRAHWAPRAQVNASRAKTD